MWVFKILNSHCFVKELRCGTLMELLPTLACYCKFGIVSVFAPFLNSLVLYTCRFFEFTVFLIFNSCLTLNLVLNLDLDFTFIVSNSE